MSFMTDDLRPLDEQAFGARVEPHRRELHVHCYRLLGSFEEAEDLVQEAFLRAWRRRETYEGRASVRAWLYRIATNACLDALDKRPRRPSASGEVAWLQPYPDELLEQLPDRREGPEDVALAKETVELAFIAAIQHLAPLPRAVLVLRDVLGCSANETARLLETTEASVNSALQRARAGLRESLPEDREAWQHATEPTAAERDLLARYVECSERADAEGLAALMHEDVRFSMPPTPGVWTGRSTVVQSWIDGGFGSEAFGSMRCVVTRANGQPAIAGYVRKPGDAAYEPLAIDVLRVQDGVVTEIVTFDGALFEHFDLPARSARGPERAPRPLIRRSRTRPSRHARRATPRSKEVSMAHISTHHRGGRYTMNAPTAVTITPVFVADLSVEGERMPVYVHVIDHPDARVLVDTGMTELHPAMADMDPRLQPLSEQDFDLAGIDIVVNTHLHADHCGGNHLFAGKPIYVQRRELDDARARTTTPFASGSRRPACGTCRSTASSSCCPGSDSSRRRATHRHADGRRRDWRAPGHRRRRRGGVVRRVRRAAHRRPAAGACARPRAGLAHARARAMATPHRLRHHAGAR